MGSPRQLEEERRLLYVAITRAERHCILTYAKSRYRYGRMEMEAPSRFLRDIDPALLAVDDAAGSMFNSTGRFNSSVDFAGRWQNSRPVAEQFKADLKPREAAHRDEAAPVDPLSPGFRRLLSASARRPTRAATVQAEVSGIAEGCTIEHDRFGIGRVVRLEGDGENRKATVEFNNAGTKQLLLKFARFKVLRS